MLILHTVCYMQSFSRDFISHAAVGMVGLHEVFSISPLYSIGRFMYRVFTNEHLRDVI